MLTELETRIVRDAGQLEDVIRQIAREARIAAEKVRSGLSDEARPLFERNTREFRDALVRLRGAMDAASAALLELHTANRPREDR